MSRVSSDQYVNGRLMNGYDYDNQAWVKDGKYVACGHPEAMNCKCYGKIHEGQETVCSHTNSSYGIPSGMKCSDCGKVFDGNN